VTTVSTKSYVSVKKHRWR